MSKVNLSTRLVGSIEGNFIIPAYQRGYRWQEEVSMLLDDIKEIPEGEKYCLQPIVIKTNGNNFFELIDGQQRLTTLYLILSYIKTFRPKMAIKYSINYEIRCDSQRFISSLDFDNLPESVANIDEYFIKEAAVTIKEWFDKQEDADNMANLIANKLNNKIYVIWYEIDSSEDSISLFTRLNIGKIPLTNAELIKAIFLSRNNGIDERYQFEIATQWDTIEQELHDDRFWYFITNQSAKSFPTRIELLFDLMANKRQDDRERLRTFFYFSDKITQYKDKKLELWKIVIEYYQRLKEWYNDSELYHKIGYLVATQEKPLQELMTESMSLSKTEFRKSLNEWIAESIRIEKEYDALSYESKADYLNIERILLLFNVESVYQNGDKSMRFPFDKHKTTIQNGGWSLEHIHAQQSEGLRTKENWNEWLELHKKSLQNIDADKYANLIKEISDRDSENLSFEQFSILFEKVINSLELEQNVEYIHSIENMALLSKNDNSALNNSTFDVKRDKIIDMDKEGCYIPICTRRVFLKYYTDSCDNQLHFWGKADREAYRKAMNETLKPYLTILNKNI